jgi:multiple sugar transport system ATP-binding protein
MVREPRAFLFDEPLSNLDARLRLETRAEIAELHRKLGATMVFVTHDQVEAMTLGQRIAVMKDGELQQYGTPMDVYRAPANLFVATFIGTPSLNSVSGTVAAEGKTAVFNAGTFELALSGGDVGDKAVVGVRPEAISLVGVEDAAATFPAVVARTESLGNETLVHCRDAGERLWVARADPDVGVQRDERVGMRLDLSRTHLFAGEGLRRVANARISMRP